MVMRQRKIALWQGGGEYPSLHITISDNPKYWEGNLTMTDVSEVMGKVEAWLKKKMEK